MRVFLDTNVLLDVALNREPFVAHAVLIWRLAEQKAITALVSGTSVTDIYYICRKHAGHDIARDFVTDILDVFSIIGVDEGGFREALASDIIDFEDAVQYTISKRAGCKSFVTRNKKDFGDRPNPAKPEPKI